MSSDQLFHPIAGSDDLKRFRGEWVQAVAGGGRGVWGRTGDDKDQDARGLFSI